MMYDNLFSCAVGENIYLLTYLLTYFSSPVHSQLRIHSIKLGDSVVYSDLEGLIVSAGSISGIIV
jgi:hypothetical protein